MNTESWRQILSRPSEACHVAQLYQDEKFLMDGVSFFAATALKNKEAAILIGTTDHNQAVINRLKAEKLNVDGAIASGQLTILNARELLDRLMVNGMPNGNIFRGVFDPLLAKSTADFLGVRIWGEMVDLLWKESELAATLRLEQLWNDLAENHTFCLLCSYRMDNLDKIAYDGALQGICKTHSHLIPHKDYALLDKAVESAVNETIGPFQAPKLRALVAAECGGKLPRMPIAQVILMWLRDGMPRVADKVLMLARNHCMYSKKLTAQNER